jgi:putative metalloprotease
MFLICLSVTIQAQFPKKIGKINVDKAVQATVKTAEALTLTDAAKLNDTTQPGDLGEALANAQYSQKQESAADKYGYEFLKTCNKDSKFMAQSLGILLKLQEEAGGDPSSKFSKLLSSHPDLKKRIATLNKLK